MSALKQIRVDNLQINSQLFNQIGIKIFHRCEVFLFFFSQSQQTINDEWRRVAINLTRTLTLNLNHCVLTKEWEQVNKQSRLLDPDVGSTTIISQQLLVENVRNIDDQPTNQPKLLVLQRYTFYRAHLVQASKQQARLLQETRI